MTTTTARLQPATTTPRAVLIGRGLRGASDAYRAWRTAARYNDLITEARKGDPKMVQVHIDRQNDEIKDHAQITGNYARVALGCMTGGHPIAVILHAAGAFWAWHVWDATKEAKEKARERTALKASALALGISVILCTVNTALAGFTVGVGGPHLAWAALTVTVLAGRFLRAIWDGDLGNDLEQAELAPAEITQDDTPPVVAAVKAAHPGKLPEGCEPALVSPGISHPAPGIWTAAVDLGGTKGGPSARRLVKPDVRADLAAQLGLSERRLIATVNEDRGSRIHLTGITGTPWKDQPAHPLLGMDRVDLWQPFPFSRSILAQEVPYDIRWTNALIGGEPGAGKSVVLTDVWAAFALSVGPGWESRIRVIDGGEVDTEPLRAHGLAYAWTTTKVEGGKILADQLADVDRRQHMLARAGLRKATPEWMAENGIGHDLLVIDELASFTQGAKDTDPFVDSLRKILQRCRKVGVHVLLATQSPSTDVIDGDARDIIPTRWAGRARTEALASKILGSGTIARGVDPRTIDRRVDGLGWFSTLTGDTLVRPYYLTDAQVQQVCRRAVAARKGAASASAGDESRRTVEAVREMIRADGVDVPVGRVMRTRDVAARLGIDQLALAGVLGEHGVGSQKVRRTDSPDDDNRMHYVLSDFPVTRAG